MPEFLRRPPEGEPLPKGGLWSGWIIFGLLFLTSFSLVPISWPWALIFLGLALFYLMTLYIIKEPEVAILFRFGQAVRELSAGWWLTIWLIHNIESETKARQILNEDEPEKESQDLYYIDGDRKIAITVNMRVFFRLVSVKQALATYGGLNKPSARADVETTALSALRTALGHRNFAELLRAKGDVEQEVEILTNSELSDIKRERLEADPDLLKEHLELAKSGYLIEGVDIYDYDEKVQSEASRIKEIADAKAYEAGKMTAAVADPLKDNYPAAIVQSVATVATTAREINQARMETARRAPTRGSTEGKGTAGEAETVGLLTALRELIDRKEGK